MDSETVKKYYSAQCVLDHYTRATTAVGLWVAEKVAFTRYFSPRSPLLELGTGTGRIAFGMESLGYTDIRAIDISRDMIGQALEIATHKRSKVEFSVADACVLPFHDGSFDGAIFGFNGLMQIPGRERRVQAMSEVFRVLRPGAFFIFTTHDRDNPHHKAFWADQERLWELGMQDSRLDDFGDRYEETPLGMLYIHIPSREEIREDIAESGFQYVSDTPRSLLANENSQVREFSDDCRFWIARKPKRCED
jgi:ubiquinone/menaquinone biosynthesis C-methylase UbiE